ncbi:MAG: hypothetical protein E3J87_10935 [Candidatus Cloacimonadota bacterium]|nr:MAG: hypothetical protein E3J87_10935 [Candidatus Cloacimonadota bacterium]
MFSLYTPNGYNIHILHIDKNNFEEVEIEKSEIEKLTFEEKKIEPQIHSYNPLPYLLPRFWLPVPIINEMTLSPGFLTFFQDVLSYHQFFIYGGYSIPTKGFLYDILYINNMFPPQISAELTKDFLSIENSFYLTFFRNYTTSHHSFTAGYEYDVLMSQNVTSKLSCIVFGYHFSNRLRFPKSIEYERGGYFTTNYRLYSERYIYIYTYHNVKAKAGCYIKGPFSHNVLAVKSASGFSLSDTTYAGRMSLGGNSGTFAVRGYDEGTYYEKTVITGTVEYSFPLLWFERGISTYPIYFRNLHAKLFSDAGTAAQDFPPNSIESMLLSFGIETTLSLDLLYSQVPCDLTVGLAVTKEGTKPSFYFTISTFIPYSFNNERIIEPNIHH